MPLYSTTDTDLLTRQSIDTNLGTPSQTAASNTSVTDKGLIGLLKGLWQTILDRLPTLTSGSVPVTIAGGGTAQTITKSSVSVTTTSATLLAANANRIGYQITNRASNTATAYIEYASVASATDGLEIPPGWERTQDYAYTGVISVIGSSNHTLIVREFVK